MSHEIMNARCVFNWACFNRADSLAIARRSFVASSPPRSRDSYVSFCSRGPTEIYYTAYVCTHMHPNFLSSKLLPTHLSSETDCVKVCRHMSMLKICVKVPELCIIHIAVATGDSAKHIQPNRDKREWSSHAHRATYRRNL